MWRVGQQCTIILDHLRFVNGVTMSCESDDAPSVIARSFSIVADCYASQLTIMVTSDLNAMQVRCEYDDGITVESIGNYQISLRSGKKSPMFYIIA